MEQIPLFKEKKSQPKPIIFPAVKPRSGRRTTWRTIPFHRNPGVYRGRITWSNDRLIQAIITHTPLKYDLGWHRLISPAEVIKIK